MSAWAVRVVARVVARLVRPASVLPESSAFIDQECVMCGATFNVSPDVVFDRRRGHYCPDCLTTHDTDQLDEWADAN